MSQRSARLIGPACAIFLFSMNLVAASGPILIDQNRALAGGITPGDEPGFPVTISKPGSYRFSGNLTLPDTTVTSRWYVPGLE